VAKQFFIKHLPIFISNSKQALFLHNQTQNLSYQFPQTLFLMLKICFLDVESKVSFLSQDFILSAARIFFSLQEKILLPRKKYFCSKKIIVLSLYQENIFFASENISVGEPFICLDSILKTKATFFI